MHGHRCVLVALAVAMTGACGEAPLELGAGAPGVGPGRAIIGGTPCTIDDHPAVGALLTKGVAPVGDPPELQTVGKMFCTGTLIAPDVVLTAAHCTEVDISFYEGAGQQIENYLTFELDVRYFWQDLEVPADSYRIKTFMRHPEYDRAAFDPYPVGLAQLKDIGLAFLEEPVAGAALATVPEEDDVDSVVLGAVLEIVGYGRMVETGSDGRKAAAESFINELNATELQVGDAPPTPVHCLGDSGGPSFLEVDDGKEPRWRVAGVTSRSYDDTRCAIGGVATRVDAFRSWVDTMMRAACNNGTRSACEDGGGLPLPSGEEQPPGSGGDTAAPDGEEPGGCGCRGAAPPVLGTGLGLLLLARPGRRRAHRVGVRGR